MAENFPNLVRDLGLQLQEANMLHQNFSPKLSSPRPIIIKHLKSKTENIKSSKRKTILFHTKELPWGYKLISQQKRCRPGESGMIYSKCWKKRTTNQDYSWPLNNTGLNYMGLFIHRFFFNSKYYSTTWSAVGWIWGCGTMTMEGWLHITWRLIQELFKGQL